MKNTIKILEDNNIKYSIKDEKIYLENIILDLSNKKLVGVLEVSMIENLEQLHCSDNCLTKIICNEKLKFLNCSNNLIKEIVCNENLKYLYCSSNKLTKIKCNENLIRLKCSNNKLTEIICNKNLFYLCCHNNPILKLNRQCFYFFNSNIYIFDNKYYHNNKEITNISFKNDKKIMKVDNKTFLIMDNYPYDISNKRNFKESKILLYS